MEDVIITVFKREYERLVKRELWLQCLEEAGVDNWQGLEEARSLLLGLVKE